LCDHSFESKQLLALLPKFAFSLEMHALLSEILLLVHFALCLSREKLTYFLETLLRRCLDVWS
jgi:hypothetical protein